MLILVTNDDGIRSPGLTALVTELRTVADVLVAAPDRQQSAVSHKITLGEPLRARQVATDEWAVSGTPVDSIFLGLHRIGSRRPDLVVSGINLGPNLGSDIFYSGTLAGAIEAVMQGIPAFAISQQLPPRAAPEQSSWWEAGRSDPRLVELLPQTAKFGATLARYLLSHPLPRNVALNVNAPNCGCSGYRWTTVGNRTYRPEVIERVDPRGIPYYWLSGPPLDVQEAPGTDVWALGQGLISVSPIGLDWNGPQDLPGSWDLQGFELHDRRSVD